MTTEIYKKLKVYEDKLSSALYSSYARFRSPELEDLSSILNEHRGSPLSRQERSCSRCFLKALQQLAKEYFAFQKSPWGKKADKAEEEPIVKEQENVEPKTEGNEV